MMLQLRDPVSFEKLSWNCLFLRIIMIIIIIIVSGHDEEGKFSSVKYTSQGTVKKGGVGVTEKNSPGMAGIRHQDLRD